MSGEIVSPNMMLPVPGVGVTEGPQYASDINSCLTLIDAHNHSSGQGVQITPSGLDISSDLSFQNHNATLLRTARFSQQSGVLALASDLRCLYAVNDDLYYNDGAGNNVRITQSGAVAGTPGSIANLVSPASASYVSLDATFVWQSDANTPANMDMGGIILRNILANSKGLTITPPAAMGSDYSIILPALPASQKIMTLDASGNMTAPYVVDNSTIEVSSNTIQVKDLGITTAKLASSAVIMSKIDTTAVSIGRLTLKQSYTSGSGNFTVPANVNYLKVVAAGGGGGGGGGAGKNNFGGGSGGSGAIEREVMIAVTPGDVIAYSVGAGGLPGAAGALNAAGGNGGAGGNTTFGSYTFYGGAQGIGGSGGTGGTATTIQLSKGLLYTLSGAGGGSGANGAAGEDSFRASGGTGGDGSGGGNASGGGGGGASAKAAGGNGGDKGVAGSNGSSASGGGGGGGGQTGGSDSGGAGGTGGNGYIDIYY